jgi:hypothetical protein
MSSRVGASHSPRRSWRRWRGDLSPFRIGDLDQIPDRLAQQRRIQPGGRLEQHRFGVGRDLVGEVTGALGEDPGMGR